MNDTDHFAKLRAVVEAAAKTYRDTQAALEVARRTYEDTKAADEVARRRWKYAEGIYGVAVDAGARR